MFQHKIKQVRQMNGNARMTVKEMFSSEIINTGCFTRFYVMMQHIINIFNNKQLVINDTVTIKHIIQTHSSITST